MKKQAVCTVLSISILMAIILPSEAAKNSKPKQPIIPPATKIMDIDKANFTVKTSNGKTVNIYTITAFTKVYHDGEPAKFEDLKKGMKISVVSSDGKVAARIDAEGPGEEPKPPAKKK